VYGCCASVLQGVSGTHRHGRIRLRRPIVVETGARAHGATSVQIRRARCKISVFLGGAGFTLVGGAWKVAACGLRYQVDPRLVWAVFVTCFQLNRQPSHRAKKACVGQGPNLTHDQAVSLQVELRRSYMVSSCQIPVTDYSLSRNLPGLRARKCVNSQNRRCDSGRRTIRIGLDSEEGIIPLSGKLR